MSRADYKYWPFDVSSADKLTPEDKAQIHFLQIAVDEGHKAYMFGGSNFGAEATNGRVGYVVWRGQSAWELTLQGDGNEWTAYVDDFECAGSSVLRWLRGEEANDIIQDTVNRQVNLPGVSLNEGE